MPESDVDSLGVYNTKRYYTDSNTVSVTATQKSLHSDISTSFRTELEVPLNDEATVKAKSGATSATGEYEYDDEYDEYEYTEREGSGEEGSQARVSKKNIKQISKNPFFSKRPGFSL